MHASIFIFECFIIKPPQKMKTKHNYYFVMLFGLLLQFISSNSFAQSATPHSEFSANSSNAALVNQLRKLSFDNIPTLYLKNGMETLTESTDPLRVISDVNSFDKLYQENVRFHQVEMIIVQLKSPSELNIVLNASQLNHFKNLKYIYFSCSFELCPQVTDSATCEKSAINAMINGDLPLGVTLLFSSEISQ
jgi:hypothetical protein